MEKVKEYFEIVKAFSESITQGLVPWWVVPVAAVILLAIIL